VLDEPRKSGMTFLPAQNTNKLPKIIIRLFVC